MPDGQTALAPGDKLRLDLPKHTHLNVALDEVDDVLQDFVRVSAAIADADHAKRRDAEIIEGLDLGNTDVELVLHALLEGADDLPLVLEGEAAIQEECDARNADCHGWVWASGKDARRTVICT